METLDLKIVNTGPVLTNLLAQLQAINVNQNVYLSPLREDHQLNASPTGHNRNVLGIREHALPELLNLLGIRSLTVDAQHDLTPLADLQVDIPKTDKEHNPWRYLQNELVIGALRSLFQHCRTVAFADWSGQAGASDLWHGLLSDVIRPVGKQDLEFIFYLGNPLTKFFFQVDEILDIISGFSRHGRVTFVLNENEAIKLWKVLNGVHADAPVPDQSFPDLKKKYRSIYRTMSIARLLVYSATNAMVFAQDEQFVMARKTVEPGVELAEDAHQNFIEGFSLGLLLQLDLPHCIALGLIVLGSYGERRSRPGQKDLLAYAHRWLEDLQKPEAMHLYQ
jgi:hypothetical protein